MSDDAKSRSPNRKNPEHPVYITETELVDIPSLEVDSTSPAEPTLRARPPSSTSNRRSLSPASALDIASLHQSASSVRDGFGAEGYFSDHSSHARPSWRHHGPNVDQDYNRVIPLTTLTRPSSRRSKFNTSLPCKWTLQFINWIKGPNPPRRYYIKPFWPQYDGYIIKIRDRYFPTKRHKLWLLVFFYFSWLLCFVAIFAHWKGTPRRLSPSYNGIPFHDYGCRTALWNKNGQCGLNGDLCKPFDGDFAVRCPSNCLSTKLLNPHTVGTEQVNYKPLVIGGGPVYRGDSHVCVAGLHQGVFSNDKGGCAVVRRIRDHANFVASQKNGIESVGFDSVFPLSFEFDLSSEKTCNGVDLQWAVLGITVFWLVILALTCGSPSIFFFSVFIMTFLQVGLVSDPPEFGWISVTEVISTTVGRLLPSIFVAVVLYKVAIKRTLEDLEAHLETSILYPLGLWFGALNNHTFDKWIPISRLTGHDLETQPGAMVALLIVIGVLIAIVLGQVVFFQREGRLPKFLLFYGLIVIVLVLLAFVPLGSLQLRIHHYILALILLPGTSIQIRPSLLYQGLLVGLFINGIARWDYASILQTTNALREDGNFNSGLPSFNRPPDIIPNFTPAGLAGITFHISIPDKRTRLGGFSILVNDVLRHEEFISYSYSQATQLPKEINWTWNQTRIEGEEGGEEVILPQYFRFAYMNPDGTVLDYTKAGIWHSNGTWQDMEGGPAG